MENYKIEYQIGQTAYIKTDREQLDRVVTGITLRPNLGVTYGLCQGVTESWHYGIELSSERDIMKVTTG